MSAAPIDAGHLRVPRLLELLGLFLHVVALGVAYDLLRAAVRVVRSVVGRARRRAHTVAPPPRTIHESLGVRP